MTHSDCSATTRRRLAGHAVPEVHPRGRVRGVHPGPARGAQRDDTGDVLRHQVRGQSRRRRIPIWPACCITGTGDVFAPGGDLGGGGGGQLADLRRGAGHGRTAVRHAAAVRQTGGGRGQRAVPGRRTADRAVRDMAVVSDRATFRVPELYRGIADTYYSQMLARLIGPVRTRDLMFTGRTLNAAGSVGLGHGRARGSARRAGARRPARCSRSAAAPHPARGRW